jgi:hypothetical protein
MSELFLAIDYSSTGPKFFYGSSWADLQPMSFAPQVVEVTDASDDLPDYSVINIGGQLHLTGQAASNYMGGAIYLKQPKIDKAVPQTLSAIAYAAKKMELTGKIDLHLKCLLPAGEIKNHRSLLEAALTDAAKNFETLNNRYKVKIKSFECKPEGLGLMLKFAEMSERSINNLSLGILSIGYRNAGFFSCQQGTPGHYRSPRLGFDTLVEIFRPMVGNLDGEDITEGLSKYLETGDAFHLQYIATFGSDIESISIAAKKARDVYCDKLKRDIQEHLPRLDYMVVGGGSVQPLLGQIIECFGGDKVYCHAGLGKAWHYPEGLRAKLSNDMAFRFADLYCFATG